MLCILSPSLCISNSFTILYTFYYLTRHISQHKICDNCMTVYLKQSTIPVHILRSLKNDSLNHTSVNKLQFWHYIYIPNGISIQMSCNMLMCFLVSNWWSGCSFICIWMYIHIPTFMILYVCISLEVCKLFPYNQ